MDGWMDGWMREDGKVLGMDVRYVLIGILVLGGVFFGIYCC